MTRPKMMIFTTENSVEYIDNFDDIAAYIKERAQKGDMVITMGAGDIYKVGDLLLK